MFIGHSAGGYYAQLFASLYPGVVKTLSLVSSMILLNCPKTKKLINAVRNQGFGVCFDVYALCQKRNELSISKDIPVFVWHGQNDTTLPLSFVDYFEKEYSEIISNMKITFFGADS